MSYIYKITNLINNKTYVGQYSGKLNYYFGSGQNIKRAVKKYGKHNFKKEIIIEGNFNKCLLNSLEIHYIQLYSPCGSPNSYNLTKGGEGQFGWKPTEEQRQNMSTAAKNRMRNHLERLRLKNLNLGRKVIWSDERRLKNRQLMVGNTWGYLTKRRFQPILQYTNDLEIIREWESITKAGLESGVSKSRIEFSLKNGVIVKGYYFKYKNK